MLGNITIGQYYPAQSPVHQLDPRTKIVAVMIYLVALFLARDYLAYGAISVISLGIILLSRIPLRTVAKGLKPIVIFIMITAVIHLFLTEGTVIWQWRFLKITRQGVDQSIFMTLRLILLIAISSLLTYTTTPIALTDGLERLLNPLRIIGVPAHELAMMMTIALRFVPTLLEETDKIMKAQQSRGANFRQGSLMKKIPMVIALLVPLFLSAFRRAEELAMAMEARGYHGGEGRTRMRVLRLGLRDAVAMAAMLFILAAMAHLRWAV